MLGISDLRVLLEELFEVRFKWYNVGLGLGLPVDVLKAIRYDCHSQCLDCLREMLTAWLKSGCNTTWEKIFEVLNSQTVGEVVLSHSLAAKYSTEVTTTRSTG